MALVSVSIGVDGRSCSVVGAGLFGGGPRGFVLLKATWASL